MQKPSSVTRSARRHFSTAYGDKCSVETLRIKTLTYKILKLHLQTRQKSLHDSSFVGLPFTAFFAISLTVNFHYYDHCLSRIVISNINLLSWMLLFSHLWLIIFDLPLLCTCFPFNVGGCGRLQIGSNQ